MTLLETFDQHILPRLPLVRQFVKRWCAPAERDEAYQVCMVRIWEQLPHFRPEGGNIEAWLHTVVRHRLHRWHSEEQRHARFALDPVRSDGSNLLDEWPSEESDIEAPSTYLLAEEQQANSQLVEALLQLPETQRRALLLVADGATLHDIARQLHCSLMQASKWCYRGRKRLKLEMEKRL